MSKLSPSADVSEKKSGKRQRTEGISFGNLAVYILTIIISIVAAVDQIALKRFYRFDPAKLQSISQQRIQQFGNDTEKLFIHIAKDLKEEYGDIVLDYDKDKWFINNAGGAMGFMVILHASISEYIIFFGTPLGTEGHTGIHLADDYFTILQGQQWSAYPGGLYANKFLPGDQNVMRRGQGGQYIMPSGQASWALELAQGWIPAMLPFGLLDTFTSTMDFVNLWKTVYYTGDAMLHSLVQGKF